jgi:hypothetical protein
MEIIVNIPDELAASALAGRQDMSRKLLEAYAVEGYKSGELTPHQVGRLLGLETPMEIDDFLKRRGAYIEYSEAEVTAQRQALQSVLPPTQK